MPDNIMLILRFHPVGSDDVSVVCEDFGGEREALKAIPHALDEERSKILTHARNDREAGAEWRGHQPGQRGIGAGVEDGQRGDGPVPVTAAGVSSPAFRSVIPRPGIVAVSRPARRRLRTARSLAQPSRSCLASIAWAAPGWPYHPVPYLPGAARSFPPPEVHRLSAEP